MVNFSPQVGSEIKDFHFAIVITKSDRPNNELLTVIPLSSKGRPYDLPLNSAVGDSIYKVLVNHLDALTEQMELHSKDIERSLDSATNEYKEEKLLVLQEFLKNYCEICDAESHYRNIKDSSFAKIQQITTISKFRIRRFINKYDPLKKAILPDSIMDQIDSEIMKYFIKNWHKLF